MLLENLSFEEVEEYLETRNVLLVPVGSVEQHSPYGLIGTDFIAAQGIALKVGQKMGIVVAPTIAYGVSPHHMDFKGSATLSPSTFMQVIIDISLSFLRHGFHRIFFINGHGGNRHAIETAFQEIKMKGNPGQLTLISWYEGLKNNSLVEDLFENKDGSHATPSEVSVTMALRPDQFKTKERKETQLQEVDYYWPLSADEMRKTFPDGRMNSAPWLASRKKGELVIELAVETLVQKINKALAVSLVE